MPPEEESYLSGLCSGYIHPLLYLYFLLTIWHAAARHGARGSACCHSCLMCLASPLSAFITMLITVSSLGLTSLPSTTLFLIL